MRSLPIVIPFLLGSLAVSMQAQALTVSNAALPATIRSTLSTGLTGFDIGPGISVFNYGSNYLVRYDMSPPSGQTDINGNQTAAYDGYLWMEVQGSYSTASNRHAITLYRDKVTPAPGNLFGQNDPSFVQPSYVDANGDLSLFLTTSDLLAGSAFYTASDPGYGGYEAGALTGELPIICLAEGCHVGATLNLVQLQYQVSGGSLQMVFNPADTRGLVYQQTSGYFGAGYSDTQTFAISAVPEPSVLAMLGCGLGMVAFAARRRRA